MLSLMCFEELTSKVLDLFMNTLNVICFEVAPKLLNLIVDNFYVLCRVDIESFWQFYETMDERKLKAIKIA